MRPGQWGRTEAGSWQERAAATEAALCRARAVGGALVARSEAGLPVALLAPRESVAFPGMLHAEAALGAEVPPRTALRRQALRRARLLQGSN